MAASGFGGTLLTSASMITRLAIGSGEILVSPGVNTTYTARRTAPAATVTGKIDVLMGASANRNVSALRRFGMAGATEGTRFKGRGRMRGLFPESLRSIVYQCGLGPRGAGCLSIWSISAKTVTKSASFLRYWRMLSRKA